MSPRRLLALLVPALIITLAIAVSGQPSPVTTSDSASDPNVSTNQSIIDIAAAKLPGEIIIAKIQTSKDELRPVNFRAGRAEQQRASANVVKARMTPKNAPPRRGSHKSLTKERT